MVLTGCFYIEPINRRAQIIAPERLCGDDVASAVPCAWDGTLLHPGEFVRLKARFKDVDGDPNNGTMHWKITPCDRRQATCDVGDRLYDSDGQIVEFTVSPTLKKTGGPVFCVIGDLDVSDERGASSGASYPWTVIQSGMAPAECTPESGAAVGRQDAAP